MTKSLSHLHYPDDSRVDLILSVLEHALRGADLLLHLHTRTHDGLFQSVEFEKKLLMQRMANLWVNPVLLR